MATFDEQRRCVMATTIADRDLDPSLNAGSVARFENISIVTLNRRIREGRFPQADYLSGPYRYWKRSTILIARERRIAENAEKLARQRQAQLDAAANARAGKRTTAVNPGTAA
jgi:hypothetical protein